ncbi:hypothetical protein Tco_0047043 [Tanacetum coccineum]
MAILNESFPQETDSDSGPRCQDTILGATAKVQTVNKEVQIQALVDGKTVIVTKTSVRRGLHLKDAKGTNCLPTATIFAELERIGYENLTQKLTFYKAFFSPQWKFLIHTILQCLSAKTTSWNEFSSTMASAIICLATNQIFNFSKYIFDNMVKILEGGVKFLMYPRGKEMDFLKQSRRKQRKDSGPTEPITDEATNEEHVSTPSYDPSQSGEDRMQLNELMDLCAKLSDKVLALENTNTSQAAEIATLKERVKKLEKKKRSITYKPRRLYKVGEEIADLDVDTEPMVNTTTTTSSILVSVADPVTTAGEVVTTASVEILEELTLAQTFIEIKSAKPKAVTTTSTTVTPASSRPKAKGIVFHD